MVNLKTVAKKDYDKKQSVWLVDGQEVTIEELKLVEVVNKFWICVLEPYGAPWKHDPKLDEQDYWTRRRKIEGMNDCYFFTEAKARAFLLDIISEKIAQAEDDLEKYQKAYRKYKRKVKK